MHELILGGQKSGKSRQAETRARDWLAARTGHRATLVATATPHDDEMRARIARHRADRLRRVPGLATLEEPLDLAGVVQRLSGPDHLIVVDCLTLWLCNLLMPPEPVPSESRRPTDATHDHAARESALCAALLAAPGPVILVSNEISLGVIPLERSVRQFLDAQGLLHQRLGRVCAQVTLMVAGRALSVPAPPPPNSLS